MSQLKKTPKHSDLIFDVGMHQGEDTEFYLRKGFRVVSFEANPELIRMCRTRLAEFLDRGQLTIVEGAIVDESTSAGSGESTVRFYMNQDKTDWGTICPDWMERNERLGTSSTVIDVATVRFSEVLEEFGIPHFLKIDIEGCDWICVEALRAFRERPDYISIESDKKSLRNIERELGTLTELGYDAFQAVDQSMLPLLQVPPRPPREGNYVDHRFPRGSSGLFGAELPEPWLSQVEVLDRYRVIHRGYRVLGDDGVITRWSFPGSSRMKYVIRRFLRLAGRPYYPGWYDTHARHSTVEQP